MLCCAAALASATMLAGCGSTADSMFAGESGWFAKPLDFSTPEWAKVSSSAPEFASSRPVQPEDLVSADGACAAAAAEAPAQATQAQAAATPTTDSAAGTAAGDPGTVRAASAPPPDRLEPAGAGAGPSPGNFPAGGGVALGMTECQVVRRAGQPQKVDISASAGGERAVVVTYQTGSWPGIYHFASGRLKEIDQAPQPPAPPKAQKTKKKKPARPKSAGATPQVYVQ